ncbi:uncharacterized protein LOC110856156 isoform X2 [Folsomia candida]|uniref:uncharacterized protein LOC110856156 isoform X2 n=1 Tax=Folsomia candida TaxID=158441 RepID=UPI000B8F979E|nr:uncharacterized protein LOC110856156 isoform X2 [Folsomia candida]
MPPSPAPVTAPVKPLTPLQLLSLKRPLQTSKRTTTVISDDVPIVYKVENLRPHEFPVVGLVVHPRIIPGFCYRVRPLNTSKHLFSGRALQLVSVGQGYGKRITFKADDGQKNVNDNFFWSDSRPEGYGFELEVVSPGDKFTLYDAHHTKIGNCEVISNEEPQVEQSHLIWPENGTIEKWVVTKLRCKIESLEGAVSEDVISGIAISSKATRTGAATLVRIMNCKRMSQRQSKKSGLTLMPGVDFHSRRITVSGATLQDVPVTYTITGLLNHEFPVIGTYVDKRILPGFHYIVRPAQSKTPLFGGKPLNLLSIGRGYGKRLTFDSTSKNNNENYFWSDSYPEGFGFAPQAVFEGHRFRIFVGEEEIGVAVVKKVEIQMVILPGGGVLKSFRIDVTCCMNVRSVITRACRVCGTAVVVRKSLNSPAKLETIESPGLDTELSKNFRYIPGEVKFVAFEHQKYLKDM